MNFKKLVHISECNGVGHKTKISIAVTTIIANSQLGNQLGISINKTTHRFPKKHQVVNHMTFFKSVNIIPTSLLFKLVEKKKFMLCKACLFMSIYNFGFYILNTPFFNVVDCHESGS